MSDEPDFSEFEDWLVDGPAGKWPHPMLDEPINDRQQAIVVRNSKLLLEKNKWRSKVSKFETEIEKIDDEISRIEQRKAYAIRFDRNQFETNDKEYDFEHFHFPCTVNFSFAKFENENVSFAGATFEDGDVWFVGTDFYDGEVKFDNSTFGAGFVMFHGAVFGIGDVTFHNTHFGEGDVSFNNTEFEHGDIIFDNATFGIGDLHFEVNVLRANSVSFQDMNVDGNLFVRSSFSKPTNFQRLNVRGTAQFSGCAFLEIPDFRDAKFDRPPEVARMIVPPPKLDGRDGLFQIAEDEEAVAKYRKLKTMALAAHDHEMDGQFFAFEMMAKRGTETKGFFPLLFNSLYGILGGYGQSFTKPMNGLLASWLLFGIVYFGLASSVLTLSDRILFAAEYSVRSAIPLLNSLFRFSISPSDSYRSDFEKRFSSVEGALGNIDSFTYLAIIQQFIGLVLLFLLLLALRNTFRLK